MVAVIALFRPLGPIALPVALAIAEVGALIYSIALMRRAGLFRLRRHAVYYAALIGGLLSGALLSHVFARAVIDDGLRLIGWSSIAGG